MATPPQSAQAPRACPASAAEPPPLPPPPQQIDLHSLAPPHGDEKAEEKDGGDDEDNDDAVDDVEEDACSICQEFVNVLAQGFLPSCDHRFHFDCIVAWAKVTNLCPLCRGKFGLVTKVDASGEVVHRERIADCKQVFRPDPADHDVAAQLRLVSEARCEICGSGDDEHVLLMCEAPGCAVANHTYCISLREVPENAWYCSRHATGTRVASDLIARRATTVSTRRRTRRLATLMSNVLSGGRTATRGSATRGGRRRRGNAAGDGAGATDGRPIRGVAAGYAVRMSRELEMVQRRADAMFARGDLSEPTLYQFASRRNGVLSTAAPASVEQMWEDHDRSRRELAGIVDEEEETSVAAAASSSHAITGNHVSKTLVPEYRELEKLMADAVSHDNYAASVSLSIPKTAKLRLVSRVKGFFGKLNQRESSKLLDMGCLAVVHQWVRAPERDLPNPQVLDAVLGALETLPIKKEHLEEERLFLDTIKQLAQLQGVARDSRERAKAIEVRWLKLYPPPATSDHARTRSDWRQQQQQIQERSNDEDSSRLPQITAFTAQRPNGKRKRQQQQEGWLEPAVEYVKAKLYPLYKGGAPNGSPQLSKERFKVIVKQVTYLFKGEAAAFQSPIMSNTGELSPLAKERLRKLIDEAYRASKGKSHHQGSGAHTSASAAAASAGYSAVPPRRNPR